MKNDLHKLIRLERRSSRNPRRKSNNTSTPSPPAGLSSAYCCSWDSFLIHTLQICPSFKPVLTTYPVGYQLPHKIPAGETRPTLLVPDGFGPDGMLRQTGRLLLRKARDPLPSPLWASGFSFSASALLVEVSSIVLCLYSACCLRVRPFVRHAQGSGVKGGCLGLGLLPTGTSARMGRYVPTFVVVRSASKLVGEDLEAKSALVGEDREVIRACAATRARATLSQDASCPRAVPYTHTTRTHRQIDAPLRTKPSPGSCTARAGSCSRRHTRSTLSV